VLTSVKILINTKFDDKCVLKFCLLKVNYPIDAIIYLAHLFCDTSYNLREVTNICMSHIEFGTFTATVCNTVLLGNQPSLSLPLSSVTDGGAEIDTKYIFVQ
jgi:hypothetical protein